MMSAQQPAAPAGGGRAPAAPPRPSIVITSPGFADATMLPKKYSCAAAADMVSPPLQWTNVPEGTQAFALLLHDPEPHQRKSRYDITHWMVWNIPGTATGLPENVPAGATRPDGTKQGKGVRGTAAYFGPCAPAGPNHHYTYELFALDAKLDLSPDATRDDFEKALDGHVLGAGIYIALFHQ